MPLDPEVRKIISSSPPLPEDLSSLSAQELRRNADRGMLSLYTEREPIGSVEDISVRTRDGSIGARIYRPAGGNLAAVVSLMARDSGLRGAPRAQALMYPVLNMADMSPSRFEFAKGYMLEERMDRWFVSQYLGDPGEARDPYASPLLAEDLRGLPPALIVTAEYDPLRDQGEIYAHRLRTAGVDAVAIRYLGMVHGFVRYYRVLGAGRDAISHVAGYLGRALRGE
ncbi:MAG: alpha/beta hydrolase [Conexivisphaera sp.]|jgi:hypothetical protein